MCENYKVLSCSILLQEILVSCRLPKCLSKPPLEAVFFAQFLFWRQILYGWALEQAWIQMPIASFMNSFYAIFILAQRSEFLIGQVIWKLIMVICEQFDFSCLKKVLKNHSLVIFFKAVQPATFMKMKCVNFRSLNVEEILIKGFAQSTLKLSRCFWWFFFDQDVYTTLYVPFLFFSPDWWWVCKTLMQRGVRIVRPPQQLHKSHQSPTQNPFPSSVWLQR